LQLLPLCINNDALIDTYLLSYSDFAIYVKLIVFNSHLPPTTST